MEGESKTALIEPTRCTWIKLAKAHILVIKWEHCLENEYVHFMSHSTFYFVQNLSWSHYYFYMVLCTCHYNFFVKRIVCTYTYYVHEAKMIFWYLFFLFYQWQTYTLPRCWLSRQFVTPRNSIIIRITQCTFYRYLCSKSGLLSRITLHCIASENITDYLCK